MVAPKAVFTVRTSATRAAPAPEFNAQIPQPKIEKQQVNPLQLPRAPNPEPSQGQVISRSKTEGGREEERVAGGRVAEGGGGKGGGVG